MKIRNFDRNGRVIPDMSKVTWPTEVSIKLWETMNPGRKAVPLKKEVAHGKPQS